MVWQRVRRFYKKLGATWDNLQGVVKAEAVKRRRAMDNSIRGVDWSGLESDKPRKSVSGDVNVRIERPKSP